MFERYTERARRVIFFARYESSKYGSPAIETEHLLLGLTREDKALINRFLPNISGEELRHLIEQRITIRGKTSAAIDLPLSDECKRILAYANEEAELLAHRYIGTEHILLGVLREDKCLAARLLVEYGMNLTATRDQLAGSTEGSGNSPEAQFPPMDRSSVHALVERLPESKLGLAHSMLEQLL
jgi:ATP-dependent Clp protease ATP-binding subunit ClpC